jgi:hypothetical protein
VIIFYNPQSPANRKPILPLSLLTMGAVSRVYDEIATVFSVAQII